MSDADAWLGRLRHDLVKRLLWPARDRREVGGAPAPGELVPAFVDREGADITASALWNALRADAPPALAREAGALARFEAALEGALAAAESGDVEGVLALDGEVEALARLARSLDGEG
jgi:hypothetical protein